MSEPTKVRAISLLLILAAALAVLLGLASSESGVQLSDPLAVCARTKGALCGGFEANGDETRYTSVADLGQLTVIARRGPDARIAATIDDAHLIGAMTVTASRLPRAGLAQAESASRARSY